MQPFWEWLIANPAIMKYVVPFVGFVLLLIVTMYVVSFLQGREISFWPPKIGAKPNIVVTVQNQSTKTILWSRLLERRGLLQEIKFDYADSPIKHGWVTLGKCDDGQVNFSNIVDGFVGRAVEFDIHTRCSIDYFVQQDAKICTHIEFIARYHPRKESVFYARVTLQDINGSIKKENAWLAFPIGDGEPKPNFGNGARDEWVVPLKPFPYHGEWAIFRIDLAEIVSKTFGQDGWQFQSLQGFRVRGTISLAKITVLK